jgi:hypothetical protein
LEWRWREKRKQMERQEDKKIMNKNDIGNYEKRREMTGVKGVKRRTRDEKEGSTCEGSNR